MRREQLPPAPRKARPGMARTTAAHAREAKPYAARETMARKCFGTRSRNGVETPKPVATSTAASQPLISRQLATPRTAFRSKPRCLDSPISRKASKSTSGNMPASSRSNHGDNSRKVQRVASRQTCKTFARFDLHNEKPRNLTLVHIWRTDWCTNEKRPGPARPWPGVSWSRQQDSNLQQAVYKTATLPLRHAGTLFSRLIIVREIPEFSKHDFHFAPGISKARYNRSGTKLTKSSVHMFKSMGASDRNQSFSTSHSSFEKVSTRNCIL